MADSFDLITRTELSACQWLEGALNWRNLSLRTFMDSGALFYPSGEEIHAGDRVQYRGTYATVVVVSTGETYELAPGYEDQAGAERGVIVCDDDGTTSTLSEFDPALVFVDRGT